MDRKRARDPMRDRVEELPDSQWRCERCGETYSGSGDPTRIRAHACGIPGRNIRACRFPVMNHSEAAISETFVSSEAEAPSANELSDLDPTESAARSADEELLPSAAPSIPSPSDIKLEEINIEHKLNSYGGGDAIMTNFSSSQVILSSVLHGLIASRLSDILLKAGISTLSYSHLIINNIGRQAIERCSIWMPLIGEDCMSTQYCLDELLYMSNTWKQRPGKVILPIFYGIKPSDIMLETTTFKRAMSRIGYQWSGISTREAWKEALKMLARLSGWVVSEPCSEEVMHLIAREVAGIIYPEIPHEGPYFVGIDRKVQQIMDLLNAEVNDKRVVAICGTGGVGKTTLAKVLYSRLSACFEGFCFLPDIRKTAQQKGDSCIQDFQTKLISNILRRKCEEITSADEGISYMREVFGDMKVLIVLDDVDPRFNLQDLVGGLDTFGHGSRIIVTCRYAGDHLGADHTYEVPELSQWEVQQLFSRYANVKHPPFDTLATDIVCVVGAVPLVVEVIGTFLYGKGDTIWKAVLQKLKEIPYEEVQKKLVISYNALDAEHKWMFLDVACSINGEDSRTAWYMWNDFSTSPFLGENEFCHFRSLVKIGDNGELWMHDELRELGRQLVRQGGYMELHKGAMQRDLSTFERAKGKEKFGAVDPQSNNFLQYQETDNQEEISSIRFLKVNPRNTSVYQACPDLRWLHLHRCPENSNETKLFPKSLVILDISWSNFTESWEGWGQIKMLNALRVLKLTGCNHLVTTPNFSGYPDLEVLILEKCCRLVKIDPSISHLKKLVSLNLNFCMELNTLPKELGSMKTLKELLIDGTSVQEIPMSIGHVEALEILSASGCLSLNQLPSSIGYLKSLLVLSLDHARITEIPTVVKELINLQKLSLRNCSSLTELPIAFGELGLPLRELDVSGTGISALPDSIGNFTSLRVLKTECCFITEFPLSILRLERLEEINASYCRSLSEFIRNDAEADHVEIWRLESLKILRLGFSRISCLPINFCDLPCLEMLDLRHCNMLRKLPDLPTSLARLQYSCKGMEMPSIGLDNVKELFLADSEPEELINRETEANLQQHWPEIQASNSRNTLKLSHNSKLRTVEIQLSHMTGIDFPGYAFPSSFRKVVLSCVNLSNISVFPPTLVSLSLQQCWSLKRLKISGLKALEELQLDHTGIHEIIGLHGLKALKILKVSYCDVEHLNGLEKLTSLRSLTVSHCDRLGKLPDISNLKMLSVLELQDGRGD